MNIHPLPPAPEDSLIEASSHSRNIMLTLHPTYVGTHPLLAQVPLTVSPFIQLPTSTTLPYTYKAMPSTLPPSATGITAASAAADGSIANPDPKPRYVVSQSGHAAHPDDIIASCRALQAHINKLQADAEKDLRELTERIAARELAEKRRVAPGWLDSDARLLEPERVGGGGGGGGGEDWMSGGSDENTSVSEQLKSLNFGGEPQAHVVSEMAAPDNDQGAQMDRAFGGLAFRPKQ